MEMTKANFVGRLMKNAENMAGYAAGAEGAGASAGWPSPRSTQGGAGAALAPVLGCGFIVPRPQADSTG